MSESAELHGVVPESSKASPVVPMGDAHPSLDAMISAQTLFFEEIVFSVNELLDRTRTETHLFAEFISKLASSHSVKDWGAMCRECSQHQLDFIRRDYERLFKHGEGMIKKTANLFNALQCG